MDFNVNFQDESRKSYNVKMLVVIMMRKAFNLIALVSSLWVSGSFAATNALLYTDDFERYTNGTLLAGTNYWYSSLSSEEVAATVLSNTTLAAAGSTNVAIIPLDVTLSNRYTAATSTSAWLRAQAKIVCYNGPTNVVYSTNSTAVFYFDSDGYCVVRNGTSGWVTITKTLSGQPAVPIDTNLFATIDVYLNYTNKTWRLNVNSIPFTNNVGFVNTSITNLMGFDVYNAGFAASYLDNVSIYDTALTPVLSVSPPALTNISIYQTGATNPSFRVISSGDGRLSYYIITNHVSAGWSMTIASNAVGTLTNNATNIVWITYNTVALSQGIYTNSFNVISTNWEEQIQTVQVVVDVYSMNVSPANLANAVLRGYNATNQTINVNAGGGGMSFTASADDGGQGWLSVSPTNGNSSGGTTNILTNTYLTDSLSPGDYEGSVTVATVDGGGATGVVSVALRVFSTPILGASPAHIRQVVDRGGNPTGEYFGVWNGSAAPIVGMAYHVFVTNDTSNIVQGVLPSDGVCTGQHDTVGIYFNNLSGFSSGSYTAVVAVAVTNYGSGYEGHWSGASNIEVVLVIAAADAPAQISATKGDYDDRVAVNWRPALSPAGGSVTYNVLRYTTFDPDYAHIIVAGLTVTNYSDVTVSPGVKYYYWVQCVNSYGQVGTNSVYDSGYRRLAAPGGLFASDGAYTNKVAVSWAVVDGAGSYYVYRSAGGAISMLYYTAGTEYEDTTVSEGVEYTYYVQSTNSICGSVMSAGETGYVLIRPTGLSASDGQYVGKVVVSWSAAPGATAYEVWKSTQTLTPPYGGGVKIGETASVSYNDPTVTAGIKYYYWLKSKNATALSGFSAREEGYAATAAVDLSLWGLVVQPRRIGLGGNPRVVSFRLGNNGGTALAGDNGTVQLAFYTSANDVIGDDDDQMIGSVNERLTLESGSRAIFGVDGGNVTLPEEAGDYYLYMRLNPVWPSTLAPASLGGWVTGRPQALEVSADGTINYQAMNDYDGDGVSDLMVHGNRSWDGRSADGFEFARSYVFGGNGVVVMGDYDGDRRTDVVIYDESRGFWEALFSGSGYAYAAAMFGGPGYRGVPGDYDGDGKTEVAVYDTVNALWYAFKVGDGRLMWGIPFGGIGYEPVIGDYDGDGIWDLALYNENNGLWYIRSVAGTLILPGGQWGGPGYRPVAGDYDGDGKWDFAVYDTTGRWHIVNIRGELIAAGLLWGAPGYRPVAGDFDGDGVSDLAVYNSTSGKWFIRTVGGSCLLLDATWGGAGHKAVGEAE